MFRENLSRHYGYYVFINTGEIDIEGLTSLTPVYHEEDEQHPGVQNIIMFPGGIQGKQMYIYQNKSNPINDDSDQKNNVLDICEVEIWETLSSVVAWPHSPNKVTLKCNTGNAVLQNYKDQCDFKPKCVLEYWNQSIIFFCSTCTLATFNASTTDAQYFQPKDTLNVGDNVTYICKKDHRLIGGNLTRICQENGSWSGEEPICKPCSEASYNTSTTNAQYYRPIDTLSVGDNVTYTCKKHHRFEAGNLTRVCQKNGSWSGEEPNCKRCKCPCKRLASQNFIKDPIVLRERVEEIKKILEVNRSELFAFKRKKISSHDGRASSTGLGMTLGVGVITFVIGAIVCSDLLMCKRRNRRKT